MYFSQSLPLTLALAGAVLAKDITIQVSDSGAGLKYTPNSVKADVGDTVKFIFNPKNHTVTEAAFTSPCVPLSGGFNSGFLPSAGNGADTPSFSYKVVDTKPHWFYCAQGKHCQGGMTGVINPPADKPQNNADSFAAAAKNANSTIPGGAVSGGTIGSEKAGSSGSSASNSTTSGAPPAKGTPYTTAWTYTSGGSVYTAATTQNVASFSAQPYTTAVVYTSNGQAYTTQSVGTQTVPVVAATGNVTPSNGAGRAVAGVAAAGAAVAAMIL